MSGYESIIRKDKAPKLESLRDDLVARKDKDFFWPTGTQVYVGRQGSGKTISAVKHVIDLKKRYPKAIIVSNLMLSSPFRAVTLRDITLPIVDTSTIGDRYIFFSDMEELKELLVKVNNGKYGVIYVIDEIHTYFNALDSKNIPIFVFTEISQQRKQRKLIIGTSQLFMRMAKPFREQCDNLIICSTMFGILTVQRAFDGMTLEQDYDGSLNGNLKRVGWFFHTRKIRNAFDTFQKVVSGEVEFENSLRLDSKTIKSMSKR